MSDVKLRRYHAASWDEPLIMEQSVPGSRGILPPLSPDSVVEAVGDAASLIPAGARRKSAPKLPEIDQYHVLQHWLRLSQETMGMDLASDIGEGTCTMKYSPKVNEQLANHTKLADVHPNQPVETIQGILELIYNLEQYIKAISGMYKVSFQPGGGSHATYTNACTIRAYHAAHGNLNKKDIVITTIFSHPCDGATPATAGFKVATLMPDESGYPDLNALKALVEEYGERIAGIMFTNPEDTGVYNPDVAEYVELIHSVGGLCFYDQANANGILGIARAFDAGFDACHFNLHKTFSAPHGCEGPAAGAYCVRNEELAKYIPTPTVEKGENGYYLDYNRPDSLGKVRSYIGNPEVMVKAYAWIRTMGPDGLKMVAETSVLNNNYLDKLLLQIKGVSRPYAPGFRLEQSRYSMDGLTQATGIETDDIRSRLVDFGIQSYWMSHHPFIVPEPFTPEPCETYSREDLDYWAAAMKQAIDEAWENPEFTQGAPYAQPIGRMIDTSIVDDESKWASTWQAYKRKNNK